MLSTRLHASAYYAVWLTKALLRLYHSRCWSLSNSMYGFDVLKQTKGVAGQRQLSEMFEIRDDDHSSSLIL